MENLKQNKEQITQTSGIIKKILIIAMLVCFIIMALTGILKSRELLRPLNIPYDKLPMARISTLHDWTGIILVLLIIIHLIFNRAWLAYLFKSEKKHKKYWIIGELVILLAAIVYLMINLNIISFSKTSETITNLASIEITWYQGEKLSSIADFHENSIKGPQYIDITGYKLDIDGMVDKNLALTYDQVLNHSKYSKVVTLNCVEGRSVKILREWILLKDLLNEAGIQTGSNTVIFYAYDGYSSSLPLDYIMNNNIILADKINWVALPPSEGFPFMVVAENKRGYKWVKWVTEIKVSNDPGFKWYREKAGYNQNGNFTWPMFEN